MWQSASTGSSRSHRARSLLPSTVTFGPYFEISRLTLLYFSAHWQRLSKHTGRDQLKGAIICLEMGSSLRSVEVSVALTTALHAHQAECAPPHHHHNKYTNTPAHNTYPTMQKLITTSVIFSEENQIMWVLCGNLSGVYFADLHQIALHCTPPHTGCMSQH